MGHYWSEIRSNTPEEQAKDKRFNEYLARRKEMKALLISLDFYEDIPFEVRKALKYCLEISLTMEKMP